MITHPWRVVNIGYKILIFARVFLHACSAFIIFLFSGSRIFERVLSFHYIFSQWLANFCTRTKFLHAYSALIIFYACISRLYLNANQFFAKLQPYSREFLIPNFCTRTQLLLYFCPWLANIFNSELRIPNYALFFLFSVSAYFVIYKKSEKT